MTLPRAAPMPGHGRAVPPVGWIKWWRLMGRKTSALAAYPLTESRLRSLVHVQNDINHLIRYERDPDLYGFTDYWTAPEGAGAAGDCEDYALAKMSWLLRLGWPRGALRIATCWAETGEYHAVLTVDTDHGAWVLDNRVAGIYPWDRYPLRYRFDKRERPDRFMWETIN